MAIEINGSTGISGVDGSAATPALQGADTNTGISFGVDEVAINTGGTERVKVDSSGDVGIGVTAPDTKLHVRLPSTSTAAIAKFERSDAAVSSQIHYDGSDGAISLETTTNHPLAFGTNNAERMRLTSNGLAGFGVTAPTFSYFDAVGFQIGATSSGGYILSNTEDNVCLFANRKNSDGDMVHFAQDGTVEGTISVSGTTVSYGGAHLSRWSQLANGAERIEILRGSVLSNIDEMCEWGEEDNEQLNRMQVSNVEGDPNVSGVFQSWDDDDDTYTNDFYCAMTGDFVIRIAQGTTVARGDLLMSAGDGTAKPQDDDIVRSKTIAKVTSTVVSCTYDDGSYCVPCVLMAC